jgi:DNA-binding YbaB/EbfC family protein
MFDNLKGMAQVAGLLKDLPKIKARLEQVKQELAEKTVTAETGGGAVRATANGLMKIVSIEVDAALMAGLADASNPQDKAIAEDLIAGAVNAALSKSREVAEKQMADAAGEMGIPLPPGGLGGLLS